MKNSLLPHTEKHCIKHAYVESSNLVHYEKNSKQRLDEQVCLTERSLQDVKCHNVQIHFLTVTKNVLKGVVPRWDVCWVVAIFESTGGGMDWQHPSTAIWQQGCVGGKALWLSDAAGVEKQLNFLHRGKGWRLWVHRLHLSSAAPENVSGVFWPAL